MPLSYDTSFNGSAWSPVRGTYGDAFVSKFFLPNGQCVDSSLSISKIVPEKGGDAGLVTVHIYGCNFQTGATVTLVQDGQSDVVANAVSVYDDGKTIDATFDLTGKAIGVYRVVVTNPDSATITLPDAFAIKAVREPEFWAEILGRPTVMGGRPAKFYLAYGNKGNIDAPGAMVWVRIPPDVIVDTNLPYLVDDADGSTVLHIPVSTVPPGTTEIIPFRITPPVREHYPFNIEVSWAMGLIPNVNADPPVVVTSELVESTDNYFKIVYHITDAEGTGNVTYEIMVSDATEETEPVVDIVETADEREYVYEVTLEDSDGQSALSSQKGYVTKAAPQVRNLRAKIRGNRRYMDALYHLYEGVTHTRDAIENVQDLTDRVQESMAAITLATTRSEITDALVEAGVIDAFDGNAAKNLANGHAAVVVMNRLTPENVPLEEVRNGFEEIMESAWGRRLYFADFRSGVYLYAFCDALKTINRDCYAIATEEQFLEAVEMWHIVNQYKKSKSGKKTSHHEVLVSGDPNEKSGIQGTDERHYTSGEKPL